MTRIRTFLAAFSLVAAVSAPASAATFVYSLSTSSAGFTGGPYGTVTVQEQAGTLLFTETLAAGYQLHQGNNNHDTFAFNLPGITDALISAVTFTGPGGTTSSYSTDTQTSEPNFGTFDYAILCPSCTGGYGTHPTSLSFTLSSASTALTLASLGASDNDSSVFFTSDLVNAGGTTGNVGATLSSAASAVPEPASWAMMLSGFAMVGWTLRRRASFRAKSPIRQATVR